MYLKLHNYAVFLYAFAYRPYFDLQLLPLDVLVLPQKLYVSTRERYHQEEGTVLIHEGTICLNSDLNHF